MQQPPPPSPSSLLLYFFCSTFDEFLGLLGSPSCIPSSWVRPRPPPQDDESCYERNARVVNTVFIPDPEELEEMKGCMTKGKKKKNPSIRGWNSLRNCLMLFGVPCLTLGILFGFLVFICIPIILSPQNQCYPLPDSWMPFLALLGIFLDIMSAISYLVASFSCPGIPPPKYRPLPRTDGLPDNFDPLSPSLSIRWCGSCSNFKPMRTHHCSKCGKCVMRGDHHCIFTAGCIGARNHKAFLLFLMYLMMVLYEGIFVSTLWLGNVVLRGDPFWAYDNTAVFVLFLLCLGWMAFVGFVMVKDQKELVAGNVTTIEKRDMRSWKQCWKINILQTNRKERLVWPYGTDNPYQNAKEIFFDGWWWSWLPTVPKDPFFGTTFDLEPSYVAAMLRYLEECPDARKKRREEEAEDDLSVFTRDPIDFH